MVERPRPRFARRLPTKRFGLGLVATTLLHELGHAVGIGHSADDGSVMYPKLIDKASVTTADQAAFAYAGSRGC